MFKEEEQQQIQSVTMGLLVVLMALLLLGNIQRPLAMTFAGSILLLSNMLQASKGFKVGFIGWALGAILFLGGVGVRMSVYANVRVDWVEVALLFVGLHFLFKTFFNSK